MLLDTFLSTLPGLMLLGVAAHHRWRMRRHGQWSWKGGGFAMFSDTSENVPLTELWVEDSDGHPSCVPVIENSDVTLRWAKAIPTERHMRTWARAVASSAWQRCGSAAHRLQPPFGSPLVIQRVVVRDRHLTFNGTETGLLRATPRAQYEVVVRPSPV